MSANIPVSEDCVARFNEMKLGQKYGYIILSIKNNEVVVEDYGDPFPANCTQRENEEVFNGLKKRLLDHVDEPKYMFFDFKVETADGRREKIAGINWCSDNCSSTKKKMVHASTWKELPKFFQGVSKFIQANDADELEYNEIAEEIAKKK